VRYLRLFAWGAFLLDLVILLQLLYNLLTSRGDSEEVAAVRGLAVMLGSVLLGIAVLLSVSTWLRIREGLWISLGLALVPLLWTANAIFASLWE
jgi:hypothetical protein